MKEETDKTWSENFVKRVAYSAGDGLGDGYEEFAQEIIDRLTSATIKAKEEERERIKDLLETAVVETSDIQDLTARLFQIFVRLNLEEPNK